MASIIIYYQAEGKKAEELEHDVPIEKAKEFCIHPDTHGQGWFCGFCLDDITYLSPVSDSALSAKLHKIFNSIREE